MSEDSENHGPQPHLGPLIGKKREPIEIKDPTKGMKSQWKKNEGLPITRIKYDGLFDWDGLYRLIYGWFIDRGYYFEEKSLKHKVPTPMGEEREYWFQGWRKMTEYAKIWIDVYMHFYEAREVEVIKDGKKKKLMKARFFIEMSGKVETDFQGRWDKSGFNLWLKDLFDQTVVRRDMDVIWSDRHYYIIYKLHTLIRQYLDMQARDNAYYDMW